MGTSANDIDIGIVVREIAGSSRVVDNIKAKLGELRAEAAKPIASALADGFKAELAALEENLALELDLVREAAAKRLVSREAAEQKETQLVATFQRQRAEIKLRETAPDARADAQTFEAERAALRARFALDQAIVREGVAKRLQTEQQGHDAITRLIEQFARDEQALSARLRGATLKPVPTVGPVQLGPQVAPALAGPAQVTPKQQQDVEQLASKINLAIGAYQRMGQQIKATDAVAVAAFRAEGNALSAYLVKLGATDQELNIIGATITRLERRAGSATVIPPIGAPTLRSYDQMNPKLKTAANAASLLSVAAVTGNGSLQGMALAAGNVAQGLAVLTTSVRIATAATGIGALVTIIATVIGLMARWREENEKTEDSFAKLLEGGETTRLRELLQRTTTDLERARAEGARLAAQRTAEVRGTGIVNISAEQVAEARQNIQNLERQLNAVSAVLTKRAQDSAKEITKTEQQLANESVRIATERTRGEFAARRVALDQELAAEKERIRASGADESKQRAATDAAERKHTQDVITLETDRANRFRTLRRQAVDELAVLQERADRGEVAAQRKTIELQLAATVDQINREVGLESVRAIRIAAARADAIAKINKLEQEQQQKALDLSREFTTGTTEAAVTGVSTLERAIADAIEQRRKAQERIDQVTIGDAEATANERLNLEVEADARRDAAIEKARREHAEELRRITDENENAILELTGRASEARRRIINAEFDERVQKAKELKAPQGALDDLETRRRLELAKVDVDDFTSRAGRALDTLDDKLKETQTLSQTGAITERQGRERVTEAYRAAREEIERIILGLEAIAEKTNNPDAARAVDQLKDKYRQLGRSLADIEDQFKPLKQAALESSQSALAGFFEGLAHLGGQDKSEIRGLTAELKSAQDELNELLAIPGQQRTGETNRRISELRSEIESTSVSLENAKSSITSWRDLFVSALQNIADALVRVSSEMLAQAIIGRLLRGFVGGAIGGATPAPAGGFTGRINVASGGLIEGPHGIDKVRANLTRREFVEPVSSVDLYGADVFEMLRRRLVSRELVRAVILGATHYQQAVRIAPYRNTTGFYSDGGLVEALRAARATSADRGGTAGTLDVSVRDSNDHIVDAVYRAMQSPKGRDITVKHVSGNGRQLGLS